MVVVARDANFSR